MSSLMRSILRKKVDRCQIELRDDLIDFETEENGTPVSHARTPLSNITHNVINGDGAWRASSMRAGGDLKKGGLWPAAGLSRASSKMKVKMMR